MLFLYRPRETRMPFPRPWSHTEQAAYNRQLQAKFESTRRVPPAVPARIERDVVGGLKDLDALHRSGALTDEEFATCKAQLLRR